MSDEDGIRRTIAKYCQLFDSKKWDHDLIVRRVHPASDPIGKSIAPALTASVLVGTSRPRLPTNRKTWRQ